MSSPGATFQVRTPGLPAPASTWTGPSSHLFQIRDLIYQVAGILQPDHRLEFLDKRCHKRLAATGVSNLQQYYDLLTRSASRTAEMTELLNEITIGETFFFRNQPQLEALKKVILPPKVEAKLKLPYSKIRIWSAGCSTGEEAYTLAILLMEEAALLKNVKFEILATDLNERSLEKARAGIYGEYAIRNLSPQLRQKYFDLQPDGKLLAVKDHVKAAIQFSRVNLLDDSKMMFMKNMDVIFCCNVMIYFDGVARKKVVQHFYNNLLPKSYLFLGHSESLFSINQQFQLVHFPGATAYHKSDKPAGGGL
jgi:chemotaxis protein methyltransferase CheR